MQKIVPDHMEVGSSKSANVREQHNTHGHQRCVSIPVRTI
jgi:hypothetical protein